MTDVEVAEFRRIVSGGLDLPQWFICRICGKMSYRGVLSHNGYGTVTFVCSKCAKGVQ